MPNSSDIAGVLLAGGKSRRMGGGDKALRDLAGRPLLARIIERAAPQVGPMMLNANGDGGRFAAFGLPVMPDVVGDFAGPLAGVLTGLEWAADHAPQCGWVASFACDAPFMPADLVARLRAAIVDQDADMACARSNGRDHPVFGLWPVRLAAELRAAVVDQDIRKVDVWTARYTLAHADFDAAPVDPFFNVNRPEDFATAETLIAGIAGIAGL
jgi:molybdenum cofactor guanylyltransferase